MIQKFFFGLLLCGLSTAASAAASDLVISEYIEGSSNNKALEFYNGTAGSIDLTTDQYLVQFYFNGSATAGTTINLSGTVASGDVFVLANSSAVAAITGVADQQAGGSWYNGDDAVVLRKGGAAGPIIDVIGQVGFDPGSAWGTTPPVTTANNTLVRFAAVCAGDTNETDAFDPATEWNGFAQDTFTDLGTHTANCAAATDLLISEYIEGSSNNKALEFYNGTTGSIDLTADQYLVQFYFNGSSTVGTTINLNGTVASGDVFVLANSSAVAAVTGVADQQAGGSWYNGDDAVVLRKGGAAGSIVDVIGQVGFDPGSAWGTTPPVTTANNTLVRFPAICAGDTNETDAFDPATEWNGFAQDTFTDLGTHTATCLGGGVAGLSIDNVSQIETDGGTTIFSFTVSLSAPAGPGGVSFDIATADDTATAGSDYVARALVGQTITAGNSTYIFDVTVNGDTTVEADETFFVNVSNVVGATLGDGQGLGTILNDDVVLTPIHDIQGSGVSSPIVGSTVTTRGIVTGRKSNGFFMQEPDATVDADPLTSEGIFVFTSSAPPAAAAVGNLVQVSATVVEFVPGSDPFQPPLTELSSPTVVQISAGNPLPAPIALTTTFPDPAGAFDQLEAVEGMRVSVASLTVNAATAGNVNETNATGSNNGVFHGVVTGVPRSLREAGIQPPDPTPAGTIPPIPRWDGNPELIRVDSDGLVGQPQLTVAVGQTVSNLVGPLDYGFRRYTILPDNSPTASGPNGSVAVSAPLPTEVTVASYNLQRFFDDVNDPAISEPVLTATAYANRLNKASLGIRNELQTPDIVGVVEVENLSTLQALASQINSDAVASAQPDPMYVAYLIEGNDVGGIDVGFLIKTAPVVGAVPRVTVNAVVQELAGTLFVNPDTSTVLLNDRPPLRLDAVVNNATGQVYPLTVIVNHLRSLSGATDTTPGPNGWATDGDRVRAKRQAQAEDLAVLVQNRQAANPNEQIVLIGDFNAFEFNDGLGDSMNTIAGTPTPDNETAVTGDGADLVNPDLDNLFDTVAVDERYSFVFDGVAQSLDHALVNAAVLSATAAPRIEHARMNAGYPEVDRNDPTTARRLSDHDPLVVYLAPNGFVPIDISIDKVVNGDPVVAGTQIDYTIDITNAGPQPALNSVWTDTLPAGTRFVSLSTVAGWTCTTPAVGATGTVSCSNPSVAVGTATFTLLISVDANVAAGTLVSNNASVSTGSPDTNPMNNSSTAQFNVSVESDLAIIMIDAPDPVTAGTNLTYTATVANAGPSDASGVTVTLPLPTGTSLVSGSVSGGGSCAGAPVVCTVTGSIAPASSRTVTITVAVAPSVLAGTALNATVTVASVSPDLVAGNNSFSTTTTVAADANLQLTLTASAVEALINEPVTFTATSLNLGPSDAQNLSISMTLNPDFRYSVHTATGATCTTPQVGTTGTIVCTWAGATAPNTTRMLQVVAYSNNQGATAVDAITDSDTSDPVTANNTGTVSVQVGFAVEEIPALSQYGLILLGLMLGLIGFVAVRRQS